MMTRSELIEEARAWLRESDWQPGGAMGARPTAEYYADFCLPLLAAERERAIEEYQAQIEAARRSVSLDGQQREFFQGGLLRAYSIGAALARANEKPEATSHPESEVQSPGPLNRREAGSGTQADKGGNTGSSGTMAEAGVPVRSQPPTALPPASPAQRQRAEELLREANICAQPGNVHSHRVDAMLAYGEEREAPLLEEVQTWKRAADYWWDATRRNGEQLKAAHARGAREALKKLRAEFSYDAYMNGMSIRSCIDKQLAGLPRPGETETTLGSSASDPRAEASGSAASGENEQPVSNRKDAGSSPAPGTISDAETLEHAATIIHRKLGMDETASVLNLYAAGLRARSAPPEADWANMAAAAWYGSEWNPKLEVDVRLVAFLRERFGEAVKALEEKNARR